MFKRIPKFRAFTSACLLSAEIFAIGRTDLFAEEANSSADWLLDAKQTRVALEELDDRFAGELKRLIDTLDTTIQRVPVDSTQSDFSNERDALLLLIGVTERLITECDAVLAAQQKYLEIGRLYASDLVNAAPTFTAAAVQCRDFAADEDYSDCRQDYLLMAAILDTLAARCEQLPSEFRPQLQAVEELYPYLQNGRQVLVRFRDVLLAIPVLRSGGEFNALDKRLEAYVQSYEKFRGSLRQLHQRLQSQPSSESNLNMAGFRRKLFAPEPTNRGSSSIQHADMRSQAYIVPQPTLASELNSTIDSLVDISGVSSRSNGARYLTALPSSSAVTNRRSRDILAFKGKSENHAYDDGWCRAEVLFLDVAVDDVIRVQNGNGRTSTVKVVSQMREISTGNIRLWHAVIVPTERHRSVWKFAIER